MCRQRGWPLTQRQLNLLLPVFSSHSPLAVNPLHRLNFNQYTLYIREIILESLKLLLHSISRGSDYCLGCDPRVYISKIPRGYYVSINIKQFRERERRIRFSMVQRKEVCLSPAPPTLSTFIVCTFTLEKMSRASRNVCTR